MMAGSDSSTSLVAVRPCWNAVSSLTPAGSVGRSPHWRAATGQYPRGWSGDDARRRRLAVALGRVAVVAAMAALAMGLRVMGMGYRREPTPLCTVAPDVADDLAATGGVAYEHGVLEIECLDHGCEIVSIAIHVIPRRGLARPAMSTTVVCDHAEAVLHEEKQLAVPSVGAQRPTMRERYDRAFAPVLVVDFGAVPGGDSAWTHSMNFSITHRFDSLIANPNQIIFYKHTASSSKELFLSRILFRVSHFVKHWKFE